MSIDERLRVALRADDPETEGPQLADALRSVEAGARRHRLVRGSAVAGLAAACALAVALALVPRGDEGAVPPLSPPSPTPDTSSVGPQGGGPLDGQWASAPLTRADVADGLRSAGLGRYAEDYVRRLPDSSFRIRVSIYNGQIAATVDGELLDHEFVLPHGTGRALVRLQGYGDSIWAWHRDGERLGLTLVRTDGVDVDGFPAEVHQQAIYGMSPFRQVT